MGRKLSDGVRGAVLIVSLLPLVFLSLHGGRARAMEVSFHNMLSGVRLKTSVESVAELRYQGVVTQKMDIGCGAAALATLLNCYYGDSVTEQEIIQVMLNGRSYEEVMKGPGFSLLDLKKYAEARGYKAQGLKGNIDGLKDYTPAIVLLKNNGFPHFVVVRGLLDGAVVLADPVLGNVSITTDEFQSRWNGVFLYINGNGKERRDTLSPREYLPPGAPSAGTLERFLGCGLRSYPFCWCEF